MILRGEIAVLRPLTVEDAERTFRWRQSERGRFLHQGAASVEEQRAWIRAHTGAGEYNFIIEYQDAPVGMIGIFAVDGQHKASFGRLIIGDEARVGSAPVASESELLVCDHIFRGLGIHKIYGDVVEDNVGMVRFRAHLGYHQDGILRDHFWDGTAYRNMILYSLLEQEYWETTRPRLVSLIQLARKYAPQPASQGQRAAED